MAQSLPATSPLRPLRPQAVSSHSEPQPLGSDSRKVMSQHREGKEVGGEKGGLIVAGVAWGLAHLSKMTLLGLERRVVLTRPWTLSETTAWALLGSGHHSNFGVWEQYRCLLG